MREVKIAPTESYWAGYRRWLLAKVVTSVWVARANATSEEAEKQV